MQIQDGEIRAAVDAAVNVLAALAHSDYGFYAGEAAGDLEREAHYASVWARDAAHTIIGIGDGTLLAPGDERAGLLTSAARASLVTLMERQYPNGQIPNVVWPRGIADTGFVPYEDCGETGGVDASSLFVIAAAEFLRHHDDADLRAAASEAVTRAVQWLLLRDTNQEGVIDSPQAGDWMDSTFVRSGKTLYNNVLFFEALRRAVDVVSDRAASERYLALAADLRRRINAAFWPEAGANWRFMVGPLGTPEADRAAGSYPHPARQAAYAAAFRTDREHYLSHIEYAEFIDKCDVLGNALAVLYGVADPARAGVVMAALHRRGLRLRCPGATYAEPVGAGDPSGMYKAHVDRFQGERWRNAPGRYHNAGIWPYVGGYQVWGLVKAGMIPEAQEELRRLCSANLETGFNEWLEYAGGEPGGNPGQAWSAALLLRAVSEVAAAGVAL